MRERVQSRRRGSRRLVSFLAFGVVLLAAWVLATNMFFGPTGPADPADTVDLQPTEPGILEPATGPGSGSLVYRKADALERIAPAQDDPAATEPPPAPELIDPVVIAAVAPSMGGTETLLSPTLVSRSVEPAESYDVPLPRTRHRIVAIPLPRPRPAFAETKFSGREITDAEIRRHANY